MPLATVSDAPEFVLDDAVFRALAVPSRGSTEVSVWALELAPGMVGEAHTLDREEVFLVHSGRIDARIGAEEVQAGPGDAVIVPADTPLRLRNAGSEPVRATVVTSAGMRATLGERTFAPPWSL